MHQIMSTSEDHSIPESMLSFSLQLLVNLSSLRSRSVPRQTWAPVLCPSCGCTAACGFCCVLRAAGVHVSRGARGKAFSTFIKSSLMLLYTSFSQRAASHSFLLFTIPYFSKLDRIRSTTKRFSF